MDLLTPQEDENWTALLAAVVAAFVLAGAIGFTLKTDNEQAKRPRVARSGRAKSDEPGIRQVRWKLIAFASQVPGKPTQKQKKAVRRVTPQAKRTVRHFYDALTVDRRALRGISRRLMSPPARRALRGKPVVPFGMRRVKTVKRRARIAIDPRTHDTAAAQVSLTLKADRGKKRVRLVHTGTLWLDRGKNGWRIIAFDFSQRERK